MRSYWKGQSKSHGPDFHFQSLWFLFRQLVLKKCYIVFHRSCLILFPQQQCKSAPIFPQPCQHLMFCGVFFFPYCLLFFLYLWTITIWVLHLLNNNSRYSRDQHISHFSCLQEISVEILYRDTVYRNAIGLLYIWLDSPPSWGFVFSNIFLLKEHYSLRKSATTTLHC